VKAKIFYMALLEGWSEPTRSESERSCGFFVAFCKHSEENDEVFSCWLKAGYFHKIIKMVLVR